MGGGVLFGNRSVLGEFNIWKDPEAAKVVTESGIPLLLHGLDVTHRAIIRKEDVSLFRERPDKVSQFVADLLDFFIGGYLKSYKMAEGPLHDPCAIAALIDPAMFTTYEAYITVEVEGEHSRGATMTDLRPEGLRTHGANGRVAMDIDREKYLQLLVSACEAPAKRLEGGAKCSGNVGLTWLPAWTGLWASSWQTPLRKGRSWASAPALAQSQGKRRWKMPYGSKKSWGSMPLFMRAQQPLF